MPVTEARVSDRSNGISEGFKARADTAAFFEAWAGAILSRHNLFTCHHPFTLATETGLPALYYANSWDLDVSADNTVFTPVEVKSVNHKFTLPNDYPYADIFVCSETSWNKKWPTTRKTQRDFLFVSRISGGIIWLPKGADVVGAALVDKTRSESYRCVTTHNSLLRSLDEFVEHVKATGTRGTHRS